MIPRRPLPFSEETTRQKVQATEDACNHSDPEPVSVACIKFRFTCIKDPPIQESDRKFR